MPLYHIKEARHGHPKFLEPKRVRFWRAMAVSEELRAVVKSEEERAWRM